MKSNLITTLAFAASLGLAVLPAVAGQTYNPCDDALSSQTVSSGGAIGLSHGGQHCAPVLTGSLTCWTPCRSGRSRTLLPQRMFSPRFLTRSTCARNSIRQRSQWSTAAGNCSMPRLMRILLGSAGAASCLPRTAGFTARTRSC